VRSAEPARDISGISESQPLVSVVIPAYNGGEYLRQSVESVLNQSYPNVELLVFDDGSTDGTPEILKAYAGRFYWECHSNMGQAATLNKGWSMAKGEFISYLSVDDMLEPGAVKIAVEVLQDNPDVVLVYGDYLLIDKKGRILETTRAPEFCYREMVAKIVCHPGPGVFFKRAEYKRIGGWNPALRQIPDFEYWLRLGLCGPFLHIPAILAQFRVHEESQSYAESSIAKADECPAVMHSYFLQSDLPEEIRILENQSVAAANAYSARLHLRAGRYGLAWRSFLSAWRRSARTALSLRTLRLFVNGLLFRSRCALSVRRGP
jgi:glycosyltransferase involved in cell wall biosynthesis